jgi:hypothetical protein
MCMLLTLQHDVIEEAVRDDGRELLRSATLL